ncbi:MAG: (d)CMP kinase [Actinomycetota bacterium]
MPANTSRRRAPRKRPDSLVIAIDGPAGSGKSTVAKGVARALRLGRLDTGAMYRVLTKAAIDQGIDPRDDRALAALARKTSFEHRGAQIMVNGRPVGRAIRTPEVSAAVSTVSAHRAVRSELVRRQRELIGKGGMVVEGRDIGTVVCPEADLKVFLVASAGERARRRHKELTAKGIRVSFERLKKELLRRDRLDTRRPISPLVPAKDAVVIDSTEKSPRQVVAEIARLAGHKPVRRAVRRNSARAR